MKKKIFIPILIILIIMVTILIFNHNSNLDSITLDINPSIELDLNKKQIVKKIVPLNDDAKDIINKDLTGKDIDTVLTNITDNLIQKGYIEINNTVEILMHSDKEEISNNIKSIIKKRFAEKQVDARIIIIEKITPEDRELAKKYDITPSKAAYINSLIKDNKNINTEEMINKPIRELTETKETGKYCDREYTLEGDFCYKEIRREPARDGQVCPDGFTQYDNNCYKDIGILETEEYECFGEYTLEGDKCVGTRELEATGNFKCETGKLVKRGEIKDRIIREAGDHNEYLCEDTSTASYPTERCYLQEHAIINGKCATGPKPLLPTPTGCADDDINYNGGCYDPTPSEPYICPNGDRYDTNDELCPDTFKYTKAIGNYSCNEGDTLNGTICLQKVLEPARHKRYCPEGYEKTKDDKCIKKDETINFINGYVCDKENTKLDGNTCIILEIIDAKH